MSKELLGDSVGSAKQVVADVRYIETSLPRVNEALGGGFPRGRVIEVYGAKSEGKTTFCQWVVKEFQKQGLNCLWGDAEGTFHNRYAESSGIDLEKLDMIDFSYGEDLLYKIKLAIATNHYDLIVLDSINAVTPSHIKDSRIEGLSMNEKMEAPKMWAEFFSRLDGGFQISSPATGKPVPSNMVYPFINPKTLKQEEDKYWHKLVHKNTVLLMINHRLDKIGMTFGQKHYTPGGERKNFSFSLRLNFKIKKTQIGKKGGEKILKNRLVIMRTEKNKIGIPLQEVLLQMNPDGTIHEPNKGLLNNDEEYDDNS